MTYTLYLKTPSMDTFRTFMTGNYDEVMEMIQYITKNYNGASYYTVLNQEEATQ